MSYALHVDYSINVNFICDYDVNNDLEFNFNVKGDFIFNVSFVSKVDNRFYINLYVDI